MCGIGCCGDVALRAQREQSVGWVAGVFDNPPGFPVQGVDILEGGKLTSNNVAGSSHDPLQSPAVASGAVSKPGGDTACQDALHSAGVEGPGILGFVPNFLSRLRKKRR